jgi:hypothetical protein
MPLPEPAPREPLHVRTVTCRGYRREDGLFDIEGHLTDTKTYAFDNAHRGTVRPGEPLHAMSLRLTVDLDLTIVEAVACTDAGPFAICPAITPAFASLEGLRIGRGFRRAVQERVGGIKGCTHLVELLGPIATTAFQTVAPLRRSRPAAGPPSHLDTCHALRRDGPVVREHHPQWYTGGEDDGA